jgi:hypothetical protein
LRLHSSGGTFSVEIGRAILTLSPDFSDRFDRFVKEWTGGKR